LRRGEERRGEEISCNLERSALADFGELLVTLVFFGASLEFLLKMQC
jgi:hypothetical protein